MSGVLCCCTNRVCELQLACIWPEVWICLYVAMHVCGFLCCRPFYDVEISTLALKLQKARLFFRLYFSCTPREMYSHLFFQGSCLSVSLYSCCSFSPGGWICMEQKACLYSSLLGKGEESCDYQMF